MLYKIPKLYILSDGLRKEIDAHGDREQISDHRGIQTPLSKQLSCKLSQMQLVVENKIISDK